MADPTKLTLGTGTLFINGVDVGYLTGNVDFFYGRTLLDFTPGDATTKVKSFVTGEEVRLVAQSAEIDIQSLRLAMGLNESAENSTSFPSYEGGPSGDAYTPHASASFDLQTFGGSRIISELPIRFEHEKPDGKDIVIVLYECVATPDLTLSFIELAGASGVMNTPMSFEAQAVTGRAIGDQIGFIADQVMGS